MEKIKVYEYNVWLGKGRIIIETLNSELPTINYGQNEEDPGQYMVFVTPKETERMDITDYGLYLKELENVYKAAKEIENLLNSL